MVAPVAPALPTFWELSSPAPWSAIDFISDLHLAEDTPRTFEAWAEHLANTPADAVFMLGDLFEVWVGDDARHAGFEARCAAVLADAASRRSLAFMAGNRDFLVGAALLKDCGVMALPDPSVLLAFGRRVLLSHGDALCLADTGYQQFRAEVRSPRWQADFLARPLAERRKLARALRDASEQRKRQHLSPLDWGDIDTAAAVGWMHEAGTPTLVHGHTHQPGTEPLAPGYVRHVLTDWDLEATSARPRAEVLRLSARGLERVPPSSAGAK